MEANSKLQKKKRIAHSHMSKSNFDEPKLPPDDFVLNIMKDMDSKNIMSSYQLSQDIKSKRQETSINRGQNPKNSNQDSYCKKQDKKFLPKRSFPLMQKCQTSLKHLHKNRCIPKPRAHVGSIPKPPKQPATFAGPSISNSKTEKREDSVKRTKIQSKAYSQVLESNLIRDSNTKSQLSKTTEKNMVTQDNVTDSSYSDDADAAYEKFIKKTKESIIASDSDSNSRVTICRKKGKSRQRNKKFKRQSTSYDNKSISKVTSIPLSDSSDSESEETFEVDKNLKHKKVAMKSHKEVPTDPSESLSDSSLDELPDQNTICSSSEEDFCVETAKDTESNADFIDKSLRAMDISAAKLSISKSTHQQSDQNPASIPIDSKTLTNQPTIDKNLDISKLDELISSDSMTTKSVKIDQVPCRVRLKRDPIVEEKADSYISTKKIISALDCIIISDESDDDASATLPSNDSSFSSNPQHKDPSIQNSGSSNFEEIEDCIIMYELPKVGSSNKLNQESMHNSTKSISLDFTASHEQPTVAKGITVNSTEINYQEPSNSDETATPETIEEFKVQIVAVKSLVQESENSFIAEEATEIEIVDLSDDSYSQNNDGSNINLEGVKQLDAEQLTKEGIEHSVSDVPFISNDQNRDSQTLLSNPIQLSSYDESPVQVNSKILEVLNKIDFDSIKEIINKANLINSESSIAGDMVMTNEKYPTSKLSTDRLSPDLTNDDISKTDAEIQGIDSAITSACVFSNDTLLEFTSNPNASKPIPSVNAGKTDTCTAKMNAGLSNKVRVGKDNASAILSSESNPIEVGMGNKNFTVCDNFEKTQIPIAKDSQLSSVKQIKVTDTKTTIDNGVEECLSPTINNKKRKGIAIYDPVIKKPKCEIFESPSDELDVIAASFTKDLSPPKKRVDALLNLYKAEYAKYMNIISTEANVTLGLKMLHDKQLEKLTHLRSSIKNLVKHDPCYHTVIQEKFDSKAQACIKNEEKLKQNILSPSSSSEKKDISVHAKTKIVINRASFAKESEKESPSHPKLAGKRTSSEDRLEAGPFTQSEIREKPSVITTPKEKFIKYMKDIKCAECGKPATARCQGCAQVFYCSNQCGVLSWKKGHNVACRRRM